MSQEEKKQELWQKSKETPANLTQVENCCFTKGQREGICIVSQDLTMGIPPKIFVKLLYWIYFKVVRTKDDIHDAVSK